MSARLLPIAILFLVAPGCVPDEPLEVVEFLQEGRQDVRLNEPLMFRCSHPVDPLSVGGSSLTILDQNGARPRGSWRVLGGRIEFRPALPVRADLADTGLAPRTTYRIVFAGFPNHAVLASADGRGLETRREFSFTTIGLDAENDRLAAFADPSPTEAPRLVSVNGTPAGEITMQGLVVGETGAIVMEFSEGLHPASVLGSSPGLYLVNGEGTGKVVPLDCAFVEGSENRKISFRPCEALARRSRYQLRNETLDFTDFAGNRIDASDFNHVEFRSGP